MAVWWRVKKGQTWPYSELHAFVCAPRRKFAPKQSRSARIVVR